MRLLLSVGRSVFPMAFAAGILGGILTLSDPGPGQILGVNVAASHVLVSFAAQYDFALATRQSLATAAMVLLIALPLAVWLAPRMVSALLVRQTKPLQPAHIKPGQAAALFTLITLFLLGTILPLSGLLHPLFQTHTFPHQQAWEIVQRTTGDTLHHAMIAGILGAALGGIMALCAGRQRKWRIFLLGCSLVIFAMPPALTSMGVMFLAAHAPSWLDFLTRSHTTVAIVEALRFFPLGVVLAMRAIGSSSPEWSYAAAIHGVPLRTYFTKVIAPWVLPSMGIAALLIAMLATANITTILLLIPPGGSTLPLAIFTVMANAPESLVAMLCLIYVGGATMVIFAGLLLENLLRRAFSKPPHTP